MKWLVSAVIMFSRSALKRTLDIVAHKAVIKWSL